MTAAALLDVVMSALQLLVSMTSPVLGVVTVMGPRSV
jgi:hypothetical protein